MRSLSMEKSPSSFRNTVQPSQPRSEAGSNMKCPARETMGSQNASTRFDFPLFPQRSSLRHGARFPTPEAIQIRMQTTLHACKAHQIALQRIRTPAIGHGHTTNGRPNRSDIDGFVKARSTSTLAAAPLQIMGGACSARGSPHSRTQTRSTPRDRPPGARSGLRSGSHRAGHRCASARAADPGERRAAAHCPR